jgi:hypothetical protein
MALVAQRLGADAITDLWPSIVAIAVVSASQAALQRWSAAPVSYYPVSCDRGLDLPVASLKATGRRHQAGV